MVHWCGRSGWWYKGLTMYGYYCYTALVAVFLLLDDSRAVASAQDLTGYTVETTKSLRRLTECGRKEQLQIVDAVFDHPKKSLPISDVIAIYNAADEVVGIREYDIDTTERAKEKLGQIEDRLGENFTVRYICVSGSVDAVNPCRHSSYIVWTQKRSVLLTNEPYFTCSRRCILEPSRPSDTHYIVWNVLVNQPQSSSFKVMYSTNVGNDWHCLDTGFHNVSTSETPLSLQFSWKHVLNLTRLWFSFGGAPFRITCDDVKNAILPTCWRKSTLPVATTTTSKSVAATPVSSSTIRTPQTAQSGTTTTSKSVAATPVSSSTIRTPQPAHSDNLKQIITVKVVLSATMVVVVFILVAVVVYRVKKRSQDPVRQTNPGTNQSVAVTSA